MLTGTTESSRLELVALPANTFVDWFHDYYKNLVEQIFVGSREFESNLVSEQ